MNKATKIVILLIASAILLAGCEDSQSAFSGSKTGNDQQFLVDCEILNSTVDSEMPLLEGDTVKTTINIKEGDVNIVVKNENGTVAYQGNDVENSEFIIGVQESGTYTFSVTGSKAEGSVHFVKLSADDAD